LIGDLHQTENSMIDTNLELIKIISNLLIL